MAGDREGYGRWLENAVGAHLVRFGLEVFYWRDRDQEIDFVARKGSRVIAIEVGTSDKKQIQPLEKFARQLGIKKTLIVGPKGVPVAEFLKSDPSRWLS